MKFQIYNHLFSSLWAINRPSLHSMFLAIAQGKSEQSFFGDADEEARIELERLEERRKPELGGGIGYIFAQGIVLKGRYWGALSLDQLEEALLQAHEDPDIGTILLHLDTPGGVVYGVPEMFNLITQIRSEGTDVIGFVDQMCCSAGQWILAACSECYATPSADVGSIGVYSAFYDWCEYLEKEGIKLELFKAGEHKGIGLPGRELTKENRKLLQDSVDETYRMFTGDITTARGDLESKWMQGQAISSADAVSIDLIDGLVWNLGEMRRTLES